MVEGPPAPTSLSAQADSGGYVWPEPELSTLPPHLILLISVGRQASPAPRSGPVGQHVTLGNTAMDPVSGSVPPDTVTAH